MSTIDRIGEPLTDELRLIRDELLDAFAAATLIPGAEGAGTAAGLGIALGVVLGTEADHAAEAAFLWMAENPARWMGHSDPTGAMRTVARHG